MKVSKESVGTEKKGAAEDKPSELQQLIEEKIKLAKKIGLWDGFDPVENYQDTVEYALIQEIDKRLWELV